MFLRDRAPEIIEALKHTRVSCEFMSRRAVLSVEHSLRRPAPFVSGLYPTASITYSPPPCHACLTRLATYYLTARTF
jgi:hypothetical protein